MNAEGRITDMEYAGRIPDVSLIVPIYGVEKFIVPSVSSMLAQTHENIEIILVDDGSRDNCGRICDDFAAKDPRVRVIHQENAGVGMARNTGMDAARGEYLYFCDPDDIIDAELVEENIALARQYDADIVEFGYRSVRVDGENRRISECEDQPMAGLEGAYTREQFWNNYPEEYRQFEALFVRIFRADPVRRAGIRFKRYMRMEDSTFLYDVYSMPFDRIVYNPKRYYTYVRRPGSAVKVFRRRMLDETYEALTHYEEIVRGAVGGDTKYDRLIAKKYCDCATWHASDMALQSSLKMGEIRRALKNYLERERFQWAFSVMKRGDGYGLSRRMALKLLAGRHYWAYIMLRRWKRK